MKKGVVLRRNEIGENGEGMRRRKNSGEEMEWGEEEFNEKWSGKKDKLNRREWERNEVEKKWNGEGRRKGQ